MANHIFSIRSFLALLALAGLVGCSTNEQGVAVSETPQVYAGTNYELVDVYRHAPKRAYQVIGHVQVTGTADATRDSIIKILRQKAASLGADAIIFSYPHHPILTGYPTHAVAIRWVKKT